MVLGLILRNRSKNYLFYNEIKLFFLESSFILLCALRRTFLTGESLQSALAVGRIQPRPRVSIARWNLKEGGGKSLV